MRFCVVAHGLGMDVVRQGMCNFTNPSAFISASSEIPYACVKVNKDMFL